LEDLGINGRLLLKCILKMGVFVFWIHVAHDSYHWQAMDTVMELLGL